MPPTGEQDDDQKTLGTEGEEGGTGEQKGEQSAEDLLKDKRVQAEIDRRVTSAIRKEQEKSEKAKIEALKEAERRAEEQKLLEDGKTKELYEAEKKRREELEARIQEQERTENLNKLMDKKTVLEPKLRNVFHNVRGDLTALDALIDDTNSVIDAIVEQRLNERLKTTPPPKSDGDSKDSSDKKVIKKRSDFKTDADKSAWIHENGLEAFKKLPV